MKNMVVSLALLLGSTSALAHTQTMRVCSVDRQGQISQIEIRVHGNHATMDVDGSILSYDVVSARFVSDLRRISAVAGERVIESSQYVLSAPQGTNTIQLAETASGNKLMIFPNEGLVGASSAECY